MTAPKPYPSASIVRDILDYDPLTGLFRWLKCLSSNVRYGASAGKVHFSGYVVIKYNNRELRAHRLAWIHYYGVEHISLIDHINCIRHDNRICNLRPANFLQNVGNSLKQRGERSSRFKGVTWHSGVCKWQASIYRRGNSKYLGLYSSEEEAAAAYMHAAQDYFGEYARLV